MSNTFSSATAVADDSAAHTLQHPLLRSLSLLCVAAAAADGKVNQRTFQCLRHL